MSKPTGALRKVFVLLLLALASLTCEAAYVDSPRFSVFNGSTVEFVGIIEYEDLSSVAYAWFRDLGMLHVDHLQQEAYYCSNSLTDNATLLQNITSDEKYSVVLNEEDQTLRLTINDAQPEDTGVYCFVLLSTPNSLEGAILLDSFLKVTVNDHYSFKLMVILLSIAAVWFVVLVIAMVIFTWQNHVKEKNADDRRQKLGVVNEAGPSTSSAQIPNGAIMPPSPPSTTGSDKPLFKSTTSQVAVHYHATGQTNVAFTSESFPDLSTSAPTIMTTTVEQNEEDVDNEYGSHYF